MTLTYRKEGGRDRWGTSVGRAIAEAVAREGADIVIWLRKSNDEVNEGKVLPMMLLEIPSQLPNAGAPTSLWGNNGAEILLVIRVG